MTKLLSEMTRADWLTRRWINTTPPGSTEMTFTDAGDFPAERRMALLRVLHARVGVEASTGENGGRRTAVNSEPVAR